METNNNNQVVEKNEFVTPTKPEDFKSGETKIVHTYDNGNTVAFLLLKDGRIAKIREGKGSDVEKATVESNGNQAKYLTAMMAATVTIDGKVPNMYELGETKMKDYMDIQTAFAEINF